MGILTVLASPQPRLTSITASSVRFIRLGPSGTWATTCLERGEVRFGYPNEPHAQCLAGDWDGARQALTERGLKAGEVSQSLRELRDFYTLQDDCLWITFAQGHLWWCFAKSEVERVADASGAMVMRRAKDGWINTGIFGAPLSVANLSTRLTQVQAYQRTICAVRESDYLLRKINNQDEPAVKQAHQALEAMLTSAYALIQGLRWAEFEVFADLLLARSGWQRVSDLGKGQAEFDLIVEQTATGERAFVQVKSRADGAVLDRSVAQFRASGSYQRMFFVCHSPDHSDSLESIGSDVHVWSGKALARRAIDAGLTGWLIERAN